MIFLFDAQMPLRLARGLKIIDQENKNEKNIVVDIYHANIVLGEGATDTEVILKANQIGAIIISEDDDFKRIRANKVLIKKHNLGYVLYKPPAHGSRYWEKVVSLILAWENLKQKIKNTELPFIFKIDKNGNIHPESF
ncbi:MAG: DUF5615 family PIN-like protein [Chitinophagaceae bacterium]